MYSYLYGLFWNVGVSGLGCSKFKMFWFDSVLDFKSSIPMCSEDSSTFLFPTSKLLCSIDSDSEQKSDIDKETYVS